MRDLLVKDDDLIVATHGRSFWVLDDVSPLRELAAKGEKAPMLFAPAEAWRVRRDTNTDTPLPADEPAGENPPNGAIIDFDLAGEAHGSVLLEVLDGDGKLVRRYSNEDPVAPRAEELRNGLIPPVWPQLSSAAADFGGHASVGMGSARDAAHGDLSRVSDCRRAASNAA